MQKKKSEIEKRLLEVGKNEYAIYGYLGGSLSRICAEAGISAGNLYRYVDGKRGLFDAIVNPVYSFLPRLIADLAGATTVLTMPLEQFSAFIGKELARVIKKNNTELRILFFGSEGTKQSDFRARIYGQILEIVIRRNLGDSEGSESERILCEVIANGYFLGLLDLIEMDIEEDRLKELIQKITLFFFNDIRKRGE